MFFFLNGTEFDQKLIGTIISVLHKSLCEWLGIKKKETPLQGEVSDQSPIWGAGGPEEKLHSHLGLQISRGIYLYGNQHRDNFKSNFQFFEPP